jgi:hypothetical protein
MQETPNTYSPDEEVPRPSTLEVVYLVAERGKQLLRSTFSDTARTRA